MDCLNCGAPLKDGLAFCTSCGTRRPAQGPVCRNCGRGLAEGAAFCPACGASNGPVPPQPDMTRARKKPKAARKPGPGGRIVLRLASVLVCLCLGLSLLATAVVLDLRRLTSEKQLQRTVEQILTPRDAVGLDVGRLTVMGLASEDAYYEIEISPDVSADDLVDMVYDALETEYGEELAVSKSQLKRFYEQSTLKERLSEKAASYVTDVIRGTDDTRITKREIVDVIEENEDLIEDVFHVPVDESLRQEVLRFVNVDELNDAIRTQVIDEIAQTQIGGVTLEDLMEGLREWTSDGTMWALIIVDILLIGLLFLTNWGRIASALRCASIPMMSVGVLLAIPTLLAQLLMGGKSIVNVLVSSLLGGIAPVHYGMLIVGVLLLIGSFVVKIFVKLAEE